MHVDDSLQLAGPIAVIGAIAGAQLSAHALATWPTSSLLWYLNLEVFRSICDGFDGLAGQWLGRDGFAQSVWIAISLGGMICTGLMLKCRLPLALASHLGLLYSGFIVYDIGAANGSAAMSGFSVSLLGGPSSLVAIPIFLGSLLSSTMSHRSYWREFLAAPPRRIMGQSVDLANGGRRLFQNVNRTALYQAKPSV